MPLQLLTESEIIGLLLDAAGWSATDRDIDTSNPQTYNFWMEEGDSILQAIIALQDETGGSFYINYQGKAKWESRNFRSINSVSSQHTFNETMSALTYDLTDRELWNHIRVSWTPAEPAGAEGGGGGSDVTSKFTYSPAFRMHFDILNHHKFYTDEGKRAASWSNVQATVLRNGIDVTSSMQIYIEKQTKTSCRVAYRNNIYDGRPAVFITSLSVDYTPLQTPTDNGDLETEFEVSVEDATSITDFGRRTRYVHIGFPMERDVALALANYYLNYYKDPVASMLMTVRNKTAALLTQMLTRRLSERITVVNADLDVNGDFYINKVDHRAMDDGKVHEAVFTIEKVEDSRQVWVLGTGALGTTTGLGA